MDAWRATGRPVSTVPVERADEVTGRVVDVRQHNEFVTGHIPGAHHVELGSILDGGLSSGPVAVMCGHGERAMTAASLLATAGRTDLTVAVGGPDDWATATGRPLQAGR